MNIDVFVPVVWMVVVLSIIAVSLMIVLYAPHLWVGALFAGFPASLGLITSVPTFKQWFFE